MKTVTNDAIGMLIADHQEVATLFEQFAALSDRSKAGKKKLAERICQALTVHTQIEEEIFYPAVRAAIKDKDLMDEALVEHAGAKELIAQIRAMDPGDALYDAKMTVLSEQIAHHVEEEQNDMFPQARESKMDLLALGEKMAAMKEALESQTA